MATWTKAKREEALDLKSGVLGGATPFVATNNGRVMVSTYFIS